MADNSQYQLKAVGDFIYIPVLFEIFNKMIS